MLGSTSFKVQEFEPDRMKVRLDLSDKPAEGWLRPVRREGPTSPWRTCSASPPATGAWRAK